VKGRVHATAAIVAIVLVATFMTATITVEVLGDADAVLATKTAILFALLLLIPSVMIAGGTGRSLVAGRTSPLLRAKQRRTAAVAVIGLGVLLPAAVILRALAAADDHGLTFLLVQAVELVGGAVNLVLLGLNARAGRTLTAARRRRRRNAHAAANPPA
jgi:hypothetical protein